LAGQFPLGGFFGFLLCFHLCSVLLDHYSGLLCLCKLRLPYTFNFLQVLLHAPNATKQHTRTLDTHDTGMVEN
jgi:hypothetical protein